MKLPKHLKVAGHVYTVEWMSRQWKDEMERQGDCLVSELRIRIAEDERLLETLLHEIGHAIYYEYSLAHVEEEEAINSLYMSGLHQVLKDNPMVVKLLG